jgi:AcrR family transcriptional regulator
LASRPSTRARKGVDKAAVAQAALAMIAADGEAAFTVRRLARHLGLDPMTLLHHFGSRDGLVRAAADTLIGEIALPPPAADWRAELRAVAHGIRALAQVRPRAFGLLTRFGSTGAHDYRQGERVYSALLQAGLPAERAARLGCTFYALVIGLGLAETGGMLQPASEAECDEIQALAAEAFPATQALAPAFRELDVDLAFDEAVAAFLAGIER